jgi:hypothetical protein
MTSQCTAIVTMTLRRPEALRRCLQAFVSESSDRQRPRFVVLDREQSGRPSFPDAIHSPRSDTWVNTHDARARVVAYLAEHGIDPDVARFGVCGSPESGFDPGANRNLGLLITAGESILSVDDDIVVGPALVSRGRESGFSVHAHGDPRENAFGVSDAALTARLASSPRTILQAVDTMLGRAIAELGVPRPTEGGLAVDPSRRVAAVVPGLLGDHGFMTGSSVLFQNEASVFAMANEERVYRDAIVGRQILRCVRQRTLCVGSGAAFMAGCFGYDNSSHGVPFLPNFGNEDALFGVMSRMANPTACIGYIPEIVRHRPVEQRTLELDSVRRPVPLRMTHLLAELLRTMPGAAGDAAFTDGFCSRTGRFLVELSLRPQADFRDCVRAACGRIWEYDVKRMDKLLEAERACPAWLEQDIVALRGALQRENERADDDLVDDTSARSGGGGIRAVQRYTGEFGRLLGAWPAMWAAFARLSVAERGARVARSV